MLRFHGPEVNRDHIVVLVSEQVSDAYLAHLGAAGVSYLFCGRKHVDVRRAMRKIGSRLGLRKLMLEGGGTFNGSALAAGEIACRLRNLLPAEMKTCITQSHHPPPYKKPLSKTPEQ